MDGEQEFKVGELITIESGACINGDQSTSARMLASFAFKKAHAEQIAAYDMLLKTFHKCLLEVKEGVELELLDSIAKESIKDRGYGSFGYWNFGDPLIWFLEDIWRPCFNIRGVELEAGMVFSIEPGIRKQSLNANVVRIQPGKNYIIEGVLRVGTMIMLDEKGYTLLAGTPKESLTVAG